MRPFKPVFILALVFTLLGPGPAMAQTLEGAMVKYNAGDFQGAMADWQALADKGRADAWFNLGQMYRRGQGISFDFPKAEEAYAKAAEAGHTAAQRELGNLYFFSIGSDDARARAIPWWQKAAGRGDAKAQYILGILYFNGDVVAKDKIIGYAWTLLAMDGGVPEALQSNTAMRGQLSESELAEAVKLAPALMTGAPNQGLYSMLIGEPFPKPRTIVAALNGTETPVVQTTETSAPEEEITGQELPATPPPLELPGKTVVAENEALEPLAENEFSGARKEALETSPPEVQDPAPEIITEEHTDTGMEEGISEPAATETAVSSGPEGLDPGQAYDLGDPVSPLVNAEGFGGAWSIQLTSFRKPENAEAHWQEVSSQYPELFDLVAKKILRFDLGPELGVYYRLRIGPFMDKAEADAKCQAIIEAGLECLVIWP